MSSTLLAQLLLLSLVSDPGVEGQPEGKPNEQTPAFVTGFTTDANGYSAVPIIGNEPLPQSGPITLTVGEKTVTLDPNAVAKPVSAPGVPPIVQPAQPVVQPAQPISAIDPALGPTVQVRVGEITDLGKSMLELTQAVKLLSGEYKTIAERQEITERQMLNAQRITRDHARANPIPIMHTTPGGQTVIAEKVAADFIFKEINDYTPPQVVKALLEKAIGSPTDDEFIHELQEWGDKIKIYAGLTGKELWQCPSIWNQYEQFCEKSGLSKVLSIVGSPTNWVPEGWSAEMLTFYQQILLIGGQFMPSIELPQDPFHWPFLDTGITMYIRGESTSDPASKIRSSTPGQNVITFSTVELAGRVRMTRKLTEDAIGAFVPTLRNELIPRAMAEALDDTLLNGDDSATHFDTKIVAPDDHRKGWKGFRFIANREAATFDVQSGSTAFEYSDGTEVMNKLGKYAAVVGEGIWILSNTAYYKLLAFDEVETMDKINLPTNVNGVVNQWYGRPVIVSDKYTNTINSSGIDTGVGTLTGFVYVNKRQFRLAHRREDTIEQANDIETGQNVIVITNRRDFQQMLPSGETTVGAGINVPT